MAGPDCPELLSLRHGRLQPQFARRRSRIGQLLQSGQAKHSRELSRITRVRFTYPGYRSRDLDGLQLSPRTGGKNDGFLQLRGSEAPS